jgi:hypothetical protein
MVDYGQIAGGLSELGFGLAGGFGSRPKVAMFHPINLGSEMGKAIGSDIGAFPQLEQLGKLYSSDLLDQLNTMLPGYSGTLAKGEADTSKLLDVSNQLLTGDLPDDVKSQIERSDAFQALSGGYAGSGMSRSLTARDLGLTSLDLMRQGASMLGQGGNSAQQWAQMAKGNMLDPSSFFITPQQQGQFDLTNTILRQQSLQNKYNQQAAPDPTMLGLMQIASQFTGGMGGGGGIGGMGSMFGGGQTDPSVFGYGFGYG